MNEGGTKGVLLAIAILLLWLAGLAFFIAFEGSKILGGPASGSESEVHKLETGLANVIQEQATTGGQA